MRRVVNATPRPVPTVREAEWAPESVWTSVENFAPTGIRSPDRPARSESLYRLSYPLINSSCFNFSYISYFSLQITNFQKAFTTTIPFSIIFLSCNFYFNIIRYKQDRDFSDVYSPGQQKKREFTSKRLYTNTSNVSVIVVTSHTKILCAFLPTTI
jgi:hypothetical protein